MHASRSTTCSGEGPTTYTLLSSPHAHTPPTHTRYEYKGKSHWWHGGVKVTYKDRLSRGESSTNAAWAPIEKTAVPGPTPGSAPIQKTVTCDKGIRFIPHPPDLRREPPREDWVEDNVKKVAQHCRKIHQIRYETDLSVTEKREWYVLGCMLSSSPHSSALPSMQHTAQATGTATTAGFLPSGESAMLKLDGTPRPLLPILETLMRFERPLITWNVFKEAPPTAFTSVFTPHTRDDGMQASNQEEQVEAPRDPRRVNNVVHKDFSQSEWRRGRASLSVEEWLDSTPPPTGTRRFGRWTFVHRQAQRSGWAIPAWTSPT